MTEAHQFLGTLNSAHALTSWILDGEYIYPDNPLGEGELGQITIPLPEGKVTLSVSDWLVKTHGTFQLYTDVDFQTYFRSANDVIKALSDIAALKELISHPPLCVSG